MRIIYFYMILVLLVSCSSPSEVDVNDKTDIIVDIPDPNAPKILINKDEIDFGYLALNIPYTQTITIKNLSSENYSIPNVEFNELVRPFYLNELEFPIILSPNGEEGDEIELQINCVQMRTGHFVDQLNIYGDSTIVVDLESKVADMFVNDIVFSPTEENGVDIKFLEIVNNGTLPINIDSIIVESNFKEYFEVQVSEIPFKLGIGFQNNIKRIPIIFSPSVEGSFEAKLIVINDAEGLIKDTCIISAHGI